MNDPSPRRWLIPPFWPVVSFAEQPSADIVWRSLGLLGGVEAKAHELLAQTAPARRAAWTELWDEFRNYIRQGELYYRSAEQVRDPSAALLYYYSFLQLAKAELLTVYPLSMFRRTTHHGLLRVHGKSMRGDALRPHSRRNITNIFPLLYEKRAGTKLTTRDMKITRLLQQVPELAWELQEMTETRARASAANHAVLANGQEVWAFLAIERAGKLLECRTTRAVINRHFKMPAQVPFGWHSYFPRKAQWNEPMLFESRDRIHLPDDADVTEEVLGACATKSFDGLRPLLDLPYHTHDQCLLTPSLLRNELVPMPASLARYALMFYVSMLVRYAPARLDRHRNAEDAWLLTSFVDQSALRLLISFLSGISGTAHVFTVGAYASA